MHGVSWGPVLLHLEMAGWLREFTQLRFEDQVHKRRLGHPSLSLVFPHD